MTVDFILRDVCCGWLPASEAGHKKPKDVAVHLLPLSLIRCMAKVDAGQDSAERAAEIQLAKNCTCRRC